jgi:archaellum component FlaC
LKKLLGKNNLEDALKKLDTLTTEEARMAIAETLKVTNRVDNKVDNVDDKIDKVDDTVNRVDDTVNRVDDTVNRVDDKVTVLFDSEQNPFLSYLRFPEHACDSKRAREVENLALSS